MLVLNRRWYSSIGWISSECGYKQVGNTVGLYARDDKVSKVMRNIRWLMVPLVLVGSWVEKGTHIRG